MLNKVDSTMLEARRRVSSLSNKSWIFAHLQTAGKGRRGRAWIDPLGNFACTCVIFPKTSIDKFSLSSFTAALSLYDTLEHFGNSNADISIKWPNDILLNGKKVAGILLETIAVSKNKIALSIGFGVNLISHPRTSELEESAYSPTSVLAETGITVDPIELLNKLAFNFANYEATLQVRGFSHLRVLLLNRIHKLGDSIVVKTANEIINGQFLDINLDGHLILKTGGATRSIAAADVYFE